MNETRTVQQTRYDDGSVSLWQLLRMIKHHLILIIFMTVLLAAGGFAIAKYAITPQYTSSSQILVNQKHSTANGAAFNNQQADIQMINTYKEIITNHQMLSTASHQLANQQPAYNLSYKKLKKMVTVKTTENSQVFELQVKSTNAQESATIANTITSIFHKRIKKIMGFDNVTVTSRAVVASKPSFPSVLLFTLCGALCGFLIGIIITVIKEA